jgi:sirohydrochlorin ferrochelatase
MVTMQNHLTRRASAFQVVIAYLQFLKPTLEECLLECQRSGATRVWVLPVFLASGGHLQKDLMRSIEAARLQVPHLEVRLTGPLGEEPEVLEGMLQAALRLVSQG